MPLLGHSEDSLDHNQPMMLWYGIEPLAKTDPAALTKLFQSCKIPIIRKWISRRLMQDYEADEQYLNALLNSSLNQPLEVKLDLMSGMSEAMNGRRRARKPKSWDSFVNSMKPSQTSESVEKARTMSAFFGDGLALESIRAIALDSNRDLNSRRNALKSLIEARSPGLREDCMNLFQVRDLSSTAAEGLALFDDQELVANAIAQFSKLYGYERAPVISALITRPKWAMAVLEAVESGKIQRELITAAMARQIRGHRDQPLIAKLTSVWGIIRDTNSGRLELINQWKSRMTESTLSKANLAQGQSIFKKACSSCHKMYGEGGTNGPDLTGSGRDNLDYLLHNIIDPSAQVPAGFRLSEIAMKDGRLLSGVISNRTPKSMTIQTPTETIAIDAGDVEEIRNTELSLMPDGLLENLQETEVRDLFGYLMKK
jgi:putative heme-binding domain-containing protein